VPYEVTFLKPKGFFGATALTRKTGTDESDTFVADNYNYLADGPIMFCKPDTAMLNINGSSILISVYSPTKKVKAAFVAEQLKPTLDAQRQYLGGKLPVNNYAFIIYLTDGFTKTGSYGALEHSYSSFYVLPEMEPENIAQTVRDVAAHEFFHIVTPLSIHAKQIQDFDFINPTMSEHLWLYEGTTEYKASHVQVKYGMMPLPQYVGVLSGKISESLTTKDKNGKLKYDDKLPFTEMSRDVLVKYKEQYNNVYAKGTLIGLCLDLILNKNSKGKYNLNSLMADLSKEYGKDKAFDDKELFAKIVALSKTPQLEDFFKKYVSGPNPLPFKELLQEVGIDYFAKKMGKETTIGGLDKALGYDMGNGFFIKTPEAFDDFGKSIGFLKDDMIKKWDGKDLNLESVDNVLNGFFSTAKPDQPFTVTIVREGKEMELKAKLIQADVEKEHVLELTPNPTPAQLELRTWWLGDKTVMKN
jgi:predicted metalloprotease with PDZ domain